MEGLTYSKVQPAYSITINGIRQFALGQKFKMDDRKTATISFGFSKNIPAKKLLTASKYGEKEVVEDDKEIITGLQGNVIEG